MADTPETIIKVGADTKPAEEAADGLFSTFRGGLTEINSGVELVMKSVTAMSKAISKAIDFAKAGEEIEAIGIRFDTLAKQAGLIPDNIASGIERAVKGTVDMEDALQAATQALVSLEAGAEKIPQLFELSKKATALFGGEVTTRFEQITMAVATGSTRMLRSIGLVIESDNVFKNYAETLGKTADKLTQAERQQAMLDAILQKGEERFKNINSSITPIAENLKRQSVAFKELGDTISTFFNNAFGDILNQKIKGITTSLEVLNIKLGEFLIGKAPSATENLKLLNAELDRMATARDMAAVRGDIGRLEQIQFETDKIKEQIVQQQQLVFQEQTKQAIQGNGIQSNNEYAASLDRVAASGQKVIDYFKRNIMEGPKIDSFAKGFDKSLRNMYQSVEDFGGAVASVLVNGFTNAFASMGRALVTGENFFTSFGKQVLSTIGTLAIMMGQFLFLIGVGILPLTWLGFAGGAAAIAAGIGLTVLGGVLQALGSGGGTPAAGAAGGGAVASGGITGPGAVENPMAQATTEEERAKAQTGVQVIVQGNIFDSRETGLQIAQIINDSFDLNGTIIRANA